VIWGNREAEYFRGEGWTGFSARRVFCPSGKSLAIEIGEKSLVLKLQISLPSFRGERQREPGISFCDKDDDAAGDISARRRGSVI
jgi:hypothetical protein